MPTRTWSDEQFIEAVRTSANIAEVKDKLGLKRGNYHHFKQHLVRLNLDTSHFGRLGASTKKRERKSLRELLQVESHISDTTTLKQRLIKLEVLRNQCYECGQLPEWNNKPLSLVIDHINGRHSDNRIENLRILCPHCHSQTDTFCGRNKVKQPEDQGIRTLTEAEKLHLDRVLLEDEKGLTFNPISQKSRKDAGANNPANKGNWPSDDLLRDWYNTITKAEIARRVGVSFNAVTKRLLKKNITRV